PRTSLEPRLGARRVGHRSVARTGEDAHRRRGVTGEPSLHVLLPPVQADGVLLKGLAVSDQIDPLFDSINGLEALFHGVAATRSTGYPDPARGTFLMTQWRHPAREEAYREAHPERAHQILLPFSAADLTDEYVFSPGARERDFDALVV